MESGAERQESPSILDYDVFELANRVFNEYPEPDALEDFGPYQIRGRIDKGGMGEVWRAYDYIAQREVAIKIPRYLWDESLKRRFAAEVSNQARLEHSFIARLYDHGVCPDGTPYFAMEFVDGKPLDHYCREKNLTLRERVRLFRNVCEAVQYAHALLVLHRDLKPSNILVKDDGTPKLLDFGIAATLARVDEPASQTQTEVGFTRAFAAPEQFRRERVGVYTDVYALGVILYQLLTDRLPYDMEDSTPGQAELMVTGDKEPEKPSVAARGLGQRARKADWKDLDVLCSTAMRKEVTRRYASVVELTQDVNRYLENKPLKAQPDTLSYRAGKFLTRHERAVVASALSFVLAVSVITFFTVRLANERDRANRESAIANAMNQFLSNDLLGQTDPFKTGQKKESFADAVSRASPRIDLQFKEQPAIAARLHQTIAIAFEHRSEFPQARREYEKASDLFKQADGPLSQDAIVVNLQRAAMEARSYEPGSLALAKTLVSRSEKPISVAERRAELEVWLLSARGVIDLTENNARGAEESFSDALRRAQGIPSFDEAARTRIKRTLAFSYIRRGEAAKAEQLLREILAFLYKTDGPDSPASLLARVNLSQALMAQKKYHEAIQNANLLYPLLVKELGEDHDITIGILGTRAASEGSLGMWNDAIRDDLTAYHTAVGKQGPASLFFSVGMLSDAGLSQCLAGRYAEGELNARTAFEQSRNVLGPRAGLTGGCAYSLAVCLIGTNKLDEATQLLRTIDVKAVTELSADSSVGASVALAQGEIAARRKDYGLAKHYADAAGPTFDQPDATVRDKEELAELRKVIRAHLPSSK